MNTAAPRRGGNPLLKLIVIGIAVLIIAIIGITSVSMVTVHGNEVGVKETWSGGVNTNVFSPKTYWLSLNEKMYTYDVSSQVFVMNDKENHTEGTKGRATPDAYKVPSAEGQTMTISLILRYHIDPTQIVQLHKSVRNNIEEKMIRPAVMRVVKDEATQMKAVDAYSGPGLALLQKKIQDALSGGAEEETAGKELRRQGIVVENFVIEHIELDPEYISQIKAKQVAQQKQLALAEQQKAETAQSLVASATAMADFNKKLVESQQVATNLVIQAQAENEKLVIAATAQARQQVIAAKAAAEANIAQAEASMKTQQLEADGKKAAMIAVAEGTMAQGKAEAVAKELMLKAYAVPGSENWVKVEVAKQIGAAFGNIKGYLPSDMKVNLLTDNFNKSVDAMTGNAIIPVTAPPATMPVK